MKKTSRENFLLGLVEFLFILLIICSILVNLDKEKKDNSQLKLPGRYLIVAKWLQVEGLVQDDVDVHAIDSAGHHAWFAEPDVSESCMTLDSIDDTGTVKYFVDIKTGKLQPYEFHQERITINTIVPGEIITLIYMYNKRLTGIPTKVIVTLIDLQNNSQEILREELELTTISEQKVAFRFSVDEMGNIVPGSFNQKPYLLKDTRRYQ